MANSISEPSESLSRKERERHRHRQDILTASEKIFSLKGYFNATIEEIAREAEFSVGTIYNFFDNKENLYQEIIHSLIANGFEDFVREVLTEPDPVQAIRLLIRLRLRQYEQHQGLFHVVIDSMPSGRFNPALLMPTECLKYHERYFEHLCAIIANGRDQGVFCSEEPLHLALTLEGVMHTFIAYWFKQRSANIQPAQLEILTRMIFRALGYKQHQE